MRGFGRSSGLELVTSYSPVISRHFRVSLSLNYTLSPGLCCPRCSDHTKSGQLRARVSHHLAELHLYFCAAFATSTNLPFSFDAMVYLTWTIVWSLNRTKHGSTRPSKGSLPRRTEEPCMGNDVLPSSVKEQELNQVYRVEVNI
jgi:hypothetical protein